MNQKLSAESYKVLALKYRPHRFDDLVGQEVVIKTLLNAFKMNRPPHAFLLSGIRGTGKTTTARLIAKLFNCLAFNPQTDSDVCNKCEPCLAIQEGHFLDVIEIDAASNTGIDDIRGIIQELTYSPSAGKYKIYIIDEVHMLSKAAFNGLLKTLEEPPSFAKFVFATTELHKIPQTILSRCQVYSLARITPDIMKNRLASILSQESIQCEPLAMEAIVKVANGSMRDALSFVEKLIAVSGNNITTAHVNDSLGLMDQQAIQQFMQEFLEGNVPLMLSKVNDFYKQGYDFVLLTEAIIQHIYTLTLLKQGANSPESEWHQSMSGVLTMSTLLRLFNSFQGLYQELKYTHDMRMAFEMGLLKILYIADMPNLTEWLQFAGQTPKQPSVQQFPQTTLLTYEQFFTELKQHFPQITEQSKE